MPTDQPPPIPRKKRSAMWWITGAVFVPLLLFLYQLFGPSPPIIVSPQTTYLTAPLLRNGLPDYEQHLLAELRAGITPENNAAALIWPAIWPGELDPPDFAPVAAELGLDKIPSQKDALVPIHRFVETLVRQQVADETKAALVANAGKENPLEELNANPDTNPEIQVDERSDRMLNQLEHTWTTAQFPDIARWVNQSKQPLDMIVAASHRPRCYFPSPSLLDNQDVNLVAMLMPGSQAVREAGRSLPVRAMWHAGENRPGEAWRDLDAVHRISRLVAQGPTIVDQLVAYVISGLACDATVNFLHESKLTPELAREIQSSLAAVAAFKGVTNSIDHFERMSFLSAIVQYAQYGISPEELDALHLDDPLTITRHATVDWNVVLQRGNEEYDKFLTAARLPNRVERRNALARAEHDRTLSTQQLNATSLIRAAFSRDARSETTASAIAGSFLESIQIAIGAQDRANTMTELTRIAAALAVFRAEHGNYPAKLDELTPTVLKSLPVDLYNSQPYIYRRTSDGYILYSTGSNGEDDGGSNEFLEMFEGYYLHDLDKATTPKAVIGTGADDISICVPRPPLKKPPTSPRESK